MKFFSILSMLLVSVSTLLPENFPFSAIRPIENQLIEKGHHHKNRRGSRGRRGRQGHQGDPGKPGATGPTGPQGPGVCPAFLGRYYASDTVIDISNPGTILTLGNDDGGVSSVLLQYTDVNPSDPTADKFVQVLPGGAGKYLVRFSVLVSVSPAPLFPVPLNLQLQIDHGSGYITTMPVDSFGPFRNAYLLVPILFLSGSSEVLVSLQDNDKLHIAVVEVPSGATIGGGTPPTRCVEFTMHRVGN
jgi:hypothetical protein